MFEDLLNIYDDFTKNERTQSLSRFAYENELEFVKREPFGEQSTVLRDFLLFPEKGVKRLLGIIHIPIRNELDGEIRFYDFVHTKDLETKTTSVVELYSPNLGNAEFIIKPKTSITKLLKFPKSKTKLFRKQYSISPSTEVPDECMDICLSSKKLRIEVRDSIFLLYRKNKQFLISEIFEMVSLAEDFVLSYTASTQDEFV